MRSGMTLNHHPQRITNEQELYAGLLCERCEARVVAGEHHDFLSSPMQSVQLGDCEWASSSVHGRSLEAASVGQIRRVRAAGGTARIALSWHKTSAVGTTYLGAPASNKTKI